MRSTPSTTRPALTVSASAGGGHAGEAPLLRLESISKAYPGVVANDHVDLTLEAGEVHALVGENGAGKSTLLSILYGLQQPDTGGIALRGQPVRFASPRAALEAGIGLVQQHFSLIPTLTVAENVSLALRSAGERVGPAAAGARVNELADRLGLDVPVDAPVESLSIAQRQRAEVLKALSHEVAVLALDEPNALLTPDEWEQLAAVLRTLAGQGVGVLLVSHKLGDVLDIADRVTVLRGGRVVASRAAHGLTADDIGVLMVGEREAGLATSAGPSAAADGGAPELLRVEDLWVTDDRGVTRVRGVSLVVGAGEIVGLAGVEGSGQVELTEALAGVRPATQGRVTLGGADMTASSVRTRQRAGLAFIPADRHGAGVIDSMTVAENLLLPVARDGLSRAGWLRREQMSGRAQQLVREFDIRTPSADVPLATLSGGNQQKVVLARELSRRPLVLVCCYPTRGLDFAATEFVRQTIVAQRERGAGVLFASVDLDELRAWTDRIVVLQGGRVVGELPAREADARRLGLMMGGKAVAV